MFRTKVFRGLFSLSVFVLSGTMVFGQDEFPIANGTVVACSGTFVDDGIENPYTDMDYVFTICPENAGDVVQVEFLNFQLQTSANPNNNDRLVIYQGDNLSSPQAGSYVADDLAGITVTGNTSNVTGCLTFQFVSLTGNSGGNAGWLGLISCTTPCDEPTQSSAIINPVPPVLGLDSVSVCIGDPVDFSGIASQAAAGFTIAQYNWNFDDGSVDTLSGANASHIFQEAGQYLVNLTVEDNNGCQNVNVTPLEIIVSTLPEIVIDFPDTICLGETANINTMLDGITWTSLPPQVVSGQTYLADDLGFDFNSPLTFDFFEPGAVLQSCDDFLDLYINMEHSYLGDLEMSIECPDGTTVVLHEFGSGGGGTYLGETIDQDGPGFIGVGYEYGWSPTSSLGFLHEDANSSNLSWTDSNGVDWSGNVVNPGIYESQNDLCDLVGCPLNGTWTFTVTDNLGIDDGNIFYWGINFNPELFPDVTTFTPEWGQESDSSFWTTSADNVMSTSANGNDLEIVPSSPGSYDYTFTCLNDFECQFDTTITIVVTEPFDFQAWDDQTIECEATTTLGVDLVGTPPPPPSCDYSLILTDTWGDGWDSGGEVEVTIGGDAESYTLASGVSETFNLAGLPHGADLQISYTAGGDATENEYVLENGNGEIIFEDGQFFTAPDEGIVFTSTVDCSPPGADFVYEWTPAASLNNPNLQFPESSGLVQSTWFYVNVYEEGHPDCAVVDSMLLTIAGALDAGDDILSCEMSYPLEGFSVGQPLWSAPAGSGISFSAPNSLNTTVTATIPGTYTITLSDTEGLSCPNDDEITINFFDGIDIEPVITQPICFGECTGSIQVTGTGGQLGAGADYTYSYSVGNPGLSPDVRNDLCFGNIEVTLADDNLCASSEIFFIDQPPAPVIDTVLTEREECAGYCNGMVEILSDEAIEYSFDNGETFVTESMNDELCGGPINVMIKDLNGCTSSEQVLVGSPTPPIANFGSESPYVELFNPVVEFINFSSGHELSDWTFGLPEILGTSDEEEPVFSFPSEAGVYAVQLIVTDSIGCLDSLIKDIEVLDELQVFIPTAFSPNNDGINDYLEVTVNDLDPNTYTFQVFDRWGEIVYESREYPTRWNGEGALSENYFVADGIYVWRIKAKSQSSTEKVELQGLITVIR